MVDRAVVRAEAEDRCGDRGEDHQRDRGGTAESRGDDRGEQVARPRRDRCPRAEHGDEAQQELDDDHGAFSVASARRPGPASAGRHDRGMTAASPSTPATVALDRAGVPYTPHVYEHHETATNFGEEAAAALGLREEQVFKTLVVSVDGTLAVAIVPVANRLDLKAIAAAVGGKKATLADPALAEKRTGYVVGGISPVGQKTALRTVLDESALAYDSIFVSGGRRGFDIELTPADLVRVTDAVTKPIART